MMYIKSPELTRNWMLTFDQHLPTSSTPPPPQGTGNFHPILLLSLMFLYSTCKWDHEVLVLLCLLYFI